MVWTSNEATDYPYSAKSAIQHFRKVDPTLYNLITEIGEYRLEIRTGMTPFDALIRSIVYQQLSGHAAGSILNRVLDLYNGSFPQPHELLNTDNDRLRACGLSHAKIRAIKDLAEKEIQGLLPSPTAIDKMQDKELIDAFTIVYGIGPWTVEMLLIFNLGRPDILPVTDLGVRRGYMVAYGQDDLPSPQELMEHGEIWKPYRSIASWYFWRAADPKFRCAE